MDTPDYNPRELLSFRTMAELFSRKAIVKAFFGLNISDTEPSSGMGSQRPKKSSKTEPRSKRSKVGNTYQKLILLDFIQARQYRTMYPAVLQTCKQIYLEAVPILYSRNVFRFNDLDTMLRLMVQIGHTNMKLIRSLDICVPINADKVSWLNLLHVLPKATTGLKSVVDMAFAQALARLPELGVEKLRIKGYHAKPWPAYFRDKLGARVVEDEDGRPHLPRDDDDDSRRKLNKYNLEAFRKYQDEQIC
ncbi:hypothetical protein F4677DRAFT_439504 [Hypoxylon crocopeplum]|nr:hypothetical protein F4677DRAFT_439504 [Hypoxylon crocopeplum]